MDSPEVANSGKAVVTTIGDKQIEVVREFDAPKHVVYRAYTEPDLIRRWWAGRRATVTSVESDLRVGGSYRYAASASEGFEEDFEAAFREVAFRGTFKEVVANERLVYTEIFEAQPQEELLTTVTFEEQDGRTTLRMLIEMGSTEARDLMAGQMEDGVQEGFDVIDEIVRELGQ
ncbi:MAG TPA: SRPBCC family protein [Solirubrobacterales bacterium]|nr:SRPBCC family protein [Solirubrobacterales bacterium]